MWVKGQERLIRKVIQDVRITVENYPENMVLPDPWIPPTTTCAISGPRNIVEFLYSDQCSFRIDVSKYNLPEGDTGLPVNLTNDMFVTRLNTEEQNRISVLDKQISPSQVLLKVIPWNIGTERPSTREISQASNQPVIPFFRLQKNIEVVVPTTGELPEGLSLGDIQVDPHEILVTGKRAALDLIESVSTPILMLNTLQNDQTLFLSLGRLPVEGVQPVSSNIRGVTVTINTRNTRKR
jgi:YbbR domain-containing protein